MSKYYIYWILLTSFFLYRFFIFFWCEERRWAPFGQVKVNDLLYVFKFLRPVFFFFFKNQIAVKPSHSPELCAHERCPCVNITAPMDIRL